MEIHSNVPNTPVPHGLLEIRFVISDGGRHIHEVVAEFTEVRRQVEIYANFSRLQLKYPLKPVQEQVRPERAFSRGG